MNILSDLYTALSALDIPIETGVFKDEAPERYIVIVPMVESFDLHADNSPSVDVQEVRLSLYSQGNYIKDKKALEKITVLMYNISWLTRAISSPEILSKINFII